MDTQMPPADNPLDEIRRNDLEYEALMTHGSLWVQCRLCPFPSNRQVKVCHLPEHLAERHGIDTSNSCAFCCGQFRNDDVENRLSWVRHRHQCYFRLTTFHGFHEDGRLTMDISDKMHATTFHINSAWCASPLSNDFIPPFDIGEMKRSATIDIFPWAQESLGEQRNDTYSTVWKSKLYYLCRMNDRRRRGLYAKNHHVARVEEQLVRANEHIRKQNKIIAELKRKGNLLLDRLLECELTVP
ncbi:hypothetical protein JTE90_028600 [Oedothorax gibbosus]|uniref:Uncharacterized protein n=1 Tax=Oedothorax gibbosus TaxID=931172 RepID=A0AAV6TXP3_9ARAC|nr:hypothetical protein JTE90_028600 [Oedothorax gibbosus]